MYSALLNKIEDSKSEMSAITDIRASTVKALIVSESHDKCTEAMYRVSLDLLESCMVTWLGLQRKGWEV